jgi:nuclear pore complex protein Nup54
MIALGPKSVTDQMELALAKWNPQSPITLFQTYLYNTVNPDQVPFYRPSIHDDEAKWEEALRNKPTPGSVPVIVKGFFQLGQRLLLQERHLTILQGRLHEINDGLTNLLRKHDLEISVRAAECKRKHLRISHQCVKLAAKVQVLRNRGYAMDSAEEELREKLLKLERSVFDPALNGRAEEIWARMVSVRERGRLLQREVERAGQTVSDEVGGAMDEEVMKRAKKVNFVTIHG